MRKNLDKNFGTWLLTISVYAVGILGPVMTIPQIVLIFSTQNAAGVSVLSWLAWTLFNVPWIVYGIVHKEHPVTISYGIWLLMCLLVTIGAVLY